MPIKEFGDTFKQAVAESTSSEIKRKIYPRNDNSDEGSNNILERHYIYNDGFNKDWGSSVIDSWHNIWEGKNNALNDDLLNPNNGNPHGVNLRKDSPIPKINIPLKIVLNHGMFEHHLLELTYQKNEKWEEEKKFSIIDAAAGYLCGKLFSQGWESWNINIKKNDISASDPSDGSHCEGFEEIVNINVLNSWRMTFGGPAKGFRSQSLDGYGNNPNDNLIMDKWLESLNKKLINFNIFNSASSFRQLWDNNWEVDEFTNDNNGDIQIIPPVGITPIIGCDDIIALGDKKNWLDTIKKEFRIAFRTQAKVATDESVIDNATIDEYLGKSLTAEEAANAYNQNNPKERILAGEIDKNGVVVIDGIAYDLKGGKDLSDTRIEKRRSSSSFEPINNLRLAFVGATKRTFPISTLTNDEIEDLIKDWESNTRRTNNSITLTPGKCRQAYDNGWDTDDIQGDKASLTSVPGSFVLDPLIKKNASRADAIKDVNNFWDKNSTSDQINGKNKDDVLGANWENEINVISGNALIDRKKNSLIKLINDQIILELLENAITAVETHWTKNAASLTGKTIEGVLNANWKDSINNKSGTAAINAERDKLIGLINGAKVVANFNEEIITTCFTEVGFPQPEAPVTKKWVKIDPNKSVLKNKDKIIELFKEIRNFDQNKLVNFLTKELSSIEMPTGNDNKEKIDNLLTKKDPEVVFKVYSVYKIKEKIDISLITKTQEDMKKWRKNNDKDKVLDKRYYPKGPDGNYTEAAMIEFLCESYKGKEHTYCKKDDKKIPGDNNLSNEQNSFFSPDRISGKLFWYLGVPAIIIGILVTVFWNNITKWWNDSESKKTEKDIW